MINLYFFLPIFFFIIFYFFHIFFNYLKISIIKNPIFLIFFSQILLPIHSLYFYLFDINIDFNDFLYYSLIYFMFIIIYIHLYIGFLKSVSLRIIYEIDKLDDKKIYLKDLNIIYSNNEIVHHRIKSLINNRWLNEDKFLKCTKKSQILVKINLFFHKIYNLQITG